MSVTFSLIDLQLVSMHMVRVRIFLCGGRHVLCLNSGHRPSLAIMQGRDPYPRIK